jgi:hypothetical protein
MNEAQILASMRGSNARYYKIVGTMIRSFWFYRPSTKLDAGPDEWEFCRWWEGAQAHTAWMPSVFTSENLKSMHQLDR